MAQLNLWWYFFLHFLFCWVIFERGRKHSILLNCKIIVVYLQLVKVDRMRSIILLPLLERNPVKSEQDFELSRAKFVRDERKLFIIKAERFLKIWLLFWNGFPEIMLRVKVRICRRVTCNFISGIHFDNINPVILYSTKKKRVK